MRRRNSHNDCGEVALYVHIPFCNSKCRYCNFYSEPIHRHNVENVISAIIAEIGSYELNSIKTVYIGGGSPSLLPHKQLFRLVGEIVSQYKKIEEFTVEVNPGQVGEDLPARLRKAGVNRLSIGAQSFIQSELDFLGRKYSSERVGEIIRWGQKAGFDNISLDLIFAVPGSTPEAWGHNLKCAIDSDVQHISAYCLTYEQDTPIQKAVMAGRVVPVDEETDRAMYETAIDELSKAGFQQYEISNFAKEGFQCRHNLTYWANKPYIGVGPGASSYWQGRRTANISDIRKYVEAAKSGGDIIAESEVPDPVEIACQTAVLNLRRRFGIDLSEFKKQTDFDAEKLFAEPIKRHREQGLIEQADGKIFLTRQALPIADFVLTDFAGV